MYDDDIEREEILEQGVWVRFFTIPAELFYNPKISKTACFLFSIISMWDHPQRGCFARDARFAALLQCSTQTVNNAIQDLVREKYIVSNGAVNQRRVLKINSAYKEFYKPLIKNFISLSNRRVIGDENRDSNESYKGTEDGPSSEDLSTSQETGQPQSPPPYPQKVIPGRPLRPRAKAAPPPRRPYPLLEFWNGLPNVQHHKDTDSKTYRRAKGLLMQLQSGSFLHDNIVDKAFLERHRVPVALRHKAWGDAQCREAMTRLSQMLTPGYWPEDKKGLARDLPTLLHNPRTRTSMALMVMVKAPELLKGRERKPVEDPHPKVTAALAPLFSGNGNGVPADVRNDLIAVVSGIIEFHKRVIPDRPHDWWHHHWPYPLLFMEDYRLWLQERVDAGRGLRPQSIAVGTKWFEGWLDEVSDRHWDSQWRPRVGK
jgi:hypothetical protein